MDRGAWRATDHGFARVGHDLVTKPPPFFTLSTNFLSRDWTSNLSIKKKKDHSTQAACKFNRRESRPQLHDKEKYIYLSRAPASLRVFLEELIMGNLGGGRSCASSVIERQEAGVCMWKVSGEGLETIV